MGKGRALQKVAGPSGSSKLAARKLRAPLTELVELGGGSAEAIVDKPKVAKVVQQITEAFCLSLFLPCWMYPSFKRLVAQEFIQLPLVKAKPVVLAPAEVAAALPLPSQPLPLGRPLAPSPISPPSVAPGSQPGGPRRGVPPVRETAIVTIGGSAGGAIGGKG
mgnify:CR=1 FL=1